MNLSIPFYIGFRYWRARKTNSFASFITFFAVTGIFLGVAALILVSSVMNGLEGQLKLRILGAVPQLTITSPYAFEDLPTFESQIKQLKGVQGVVSMASTQAMIQSPNDIHAIELYGVFPKQVDKLSNVEKHMVMGSFNLLSAGKYHIVLGWELAKKLGVEIGDKVRVLSGDGVIYSPFGPMPSQRKFTVSGIFEMGSQVDGNIAYVQYNDARRLMRLPANEINQLRLYLMDPFSASQQIPFIEKIAKNNHLSIKITDWRENYGHLFSAVKMEKNMMSLMLSLIVAVAAFNIVSALVMMVVDKTADVAVLKTQGLSTQQIMGIFMVQGSLNALLGLLLGVVFGVLLTLNLNTIFNELGVNLLGVGQSLPVDINVMQLVWIIIGTLVITFAATLYPAIRAAKVQPAVVLRYE